MLKSIKVFAPATVSNVGCGFDTIGFAINGLGDELLLKPNKNNILRIAKITGDHKRLPLDSEKNTATVAIKSMLKSLKSNQGFDIEIRKKMPLCSGLGSSAASAVAGVFGLNEILERPFSKDELLKFALDGEFIASRALHADNVAPSLFGGFNLIRSYDPIDIIKIDPPKSLYCVVLHIHTEINTAESRKLISKSISLKKAREHFGNIGSLIHGLHTSNYTLIGRSIQDFIAETRRGEMIPNYFKVKEAALKAGAFGCNISGSGPSIFALSNSSKHSINIGNAMKKAVTYKNLKSKIYISKINSDGPIILG